MQRREFLVRLGGVVIAVPAVLELVGCGDDGPANPSNAVSYDVTSTGPTPVSDGHTHRINVLCSQLSGGDFRFTSTSTGHTHTVFLTMAEFQMIAAGGQVTKTSSSNGGHTHEWTIRTPTGAC